MEDIFSSATPIVSRSHTSAWRIRRQARAAESQDRKIRQTQGLAVADPRDPGLQAVLTDKGMNYKQYVDELEEAGFKVHADNEYLITYADPALGNKGFYSDYDLHGVYDKQGNLWTLPK